MCEDVGPLSPREQCTRQPTKDTEAAVGDVQMPEVDPQVISRHVGLIVGVDGDGVDVVGVGVGKHSPRAHLHHQVHWHQHRHLKTQEERKRAV